MRWPRFRMVPNLQCICNNCNLPMNSNGNNVILVLTALNYPLSLVYKQRIVVNSNNNKRIEDQQVCMMVVFPLTNSFTERYSLDSGLFNAIQLPFLEKQSSVKLSQFLRKMFGARQRYSVPSLTLICVSSVLNTNIKRI